MIKFKRLLKVMLSTSLFSITSLSVISCSRKPNGNLVLGVNTSSKYPEQFNSQTGPKDGVDNSSKSGENFHTFFGDSTFTYSAYNQVKGKPYFYGNKDGMFKMDPIFSPTQSVWKNEGFNLQWILISKKDSSKYTDLKIEVLNPYDKKDQDNSIQVKANFEKYILTYENQKESTNLIREKQYIADAIGGDTMDTLGQYDVMPIWISGFVGKNINASTYNFDVKLSYKYDGGKTETETSTFKLDVKKYILDMDDSNLQTEEQFGFSTNQYPSDGFKYFDGVILEPTELNPVPPQGESQWGPNNFLPWYLRYESNTKKLNKYFDPLKKSNNSYLWATGFHKQLIQYAGKLDKRDENWTDENYYNYIEGIDLKGKNISMDKVLKDKDWKFEFTFDGFDEYLEFIAKNDYRQLNINLYETGNFSMWYLINGAEYGRQVDISLNGGIINSSNGKPTTDGFAYLDTIYKEAVKSLSQHLKDISKNERFLDKHGKLPKVNVMYDEINELSMDNATRVLKENEVAGAPKIGSTAFVGWRSDLDLSNSNSIRDNFLDKYDQHIIHLRDIKNSFSNSDLSILRNAVSKRNKAGLGSYMYSTWNTYPGSYIQSDLSEMYWNIYFSLNLGMNGFFRWGYDKIYSDWYNTQDMNDGHVDNTGEPGQSFLVYGGDDDTGAYYSTRMFAYIDAVEQAWKFKQLSKESAEMKRDLNKALSIIGFSSVYRSNNDYKWRNENVNTKMFDLKLASNNYSKTVAEQVFEFTKYIDKF